MEFKNVIIQLKYLLVLSETGIRTEYKSQLNIALDKRVEALQTAISHLETLQKVKEAGGVKKEKIPEIKQNFQSLFPEEIGLLLHQRSKIIGYNEALDLKDAELAGKLEEKKLVSICVSAYAKNESFIDVAKGIQELILGKKEG